MSFKYLLSRTLIPLLIAALIIHPGTAQAASFSTLLSQLQSALTTLQATIITALPFGRVLGESVSAGDPGVIDLGVAGTKEVFGQRTTTLIPDGSGSVSIITQPAHGQVSVNPDNTMALVLTRTEYTGALSFQYRVGGSTRTATFTVLASPQQKGWGTSENHYMLAVDEDDRVIVEPGENHKKVYVSEDGLTSADIATREGVSASTITWRWLRDDVVGQTYGVTEATALGPELGFQLWNEINHKNESSNWLLMERGHEYTPEYLFPREAFGESGLHPMYIGAYGEGSAPVVTTFPRMLGKSENIVVQGLELPGGFVGINPHKNILFNDIVFSGSEIVVQSSPDNRMKGITFRNSAFVDAWRTTVVDGNSDGFWDAHAGRKSGIYAAGIDGLLFDGVFFDHNGWAPNFAADGSITGGHPPSMFSHNLYVQWDTTDVTMRDSATVRAASFGAQFRGGAFLEDNLFADNNIAFNVLGGEYGGRGPIHNYSLVNGNVVTQAGFRGANAPMIGATQWGMQNEAFLTTFTDNIVTHANDPDDATDTTLGTAPLHNARGAAAVFTDDTIIYRWGTTDINLGTLSTATLDQTTIQRYTAEELNGPGTVAGFAEHVRQLDTNQYKAAVADTLAYFRTGFGVSTPSNRPNLRFIPDVRGDGVRWDNRLNWDEAQIPTDNDDLDLGGNEVIFGGMVSIDDLTLGDTGTLIIPNGHLTVDTLETSANNTIELRNAGQLQLAGFTDRDPLTVTIDGGRLTNVGTVSGPTTITVANHGQLLLARDAATFDLDGALTITGSDARVGFDGSENNDASFNLTANSVLTLTADATGITPITEFRSGAFGTTDPRINSTIDLDANATLAVNLSAASVAPGDTFTILDADTLTGQFGTHNITGWNRTGVTGAVLTYNYNLGSLTLTLQNTGTGVTQAIVGTPAAPDSDGDGVLNATDNCVDDANANQADSDNDGIGDVCDSANDSLTANFSTGDFVRVNESVDLSQGVAGSVMETLPANQRGRVVSQSGVLGDTFWQRVNFGPGRVGYVPQTSLRAVPAPAAQPKQGDTTLRHRSVVDLDDNNISDELEDRIATMLWRTNTQRFHSLAVNAGRISQFRNQTEATIADDPAHEYPLGLYEFTAQTAPNATTSVVLYLDETYDTSDWVYRKYNGSTYIDISDQVTYGTTVIDGQTVTTITYDVRDNGPLDTDNRLGFITDPAGPAILTTADEPTDTGGSGSGGSTVSDRSSSGGGGGGGGGGGRRSSSQADDISDPAPTTEIDTPTTQPVVTTIPTGFSFDRNISFIQPEFNELTDVLRLQQFLNDFEGERLSLNGVYDNASNEAIKRFQRKYKREILDVWGLTEATGYVGVTTRLKMNFLTKGQTAICPAFVEFNGGISGVMFSSEIGKTQDILRSLDMYTGPTNNTWDRATNDALVIFQETFREVMLDPWNITEGTGYKYKTTNKFLNYFAGCDTGAVELEGVGVYEGI